MSIQHPLAHALQNRILMIDGAMGTMIQSYEYLCWHELDWRNN